MKVVALQNDHIRYLIKKKNGIQIKELVLISLTFDQVRQN